MVSYYGKVIEFLTSGSLKLGHVTKEGKSRLRVIDRNGRHHSVTPNNVAVIHEGPEDSTPFSDRADQLELEILCLQREVDTELLWDTVSSEARIHTADELSRLYFGMIQPSQISAVYRAVEKDQIRFKVRGLSILPRSPEQVEQQLQAILRRKEKATLRMQAINWMREILRIGEVTAIPNEMEDLVRRVEDFLKRREGTQVQAWLSEVSPDLTPVEAAIELLALTGRLREDAHHLLIAAGIEERFPHEVSQQCSRIRPYRANSGRPDYSDRLTFTIDDEDTNELDDALTLEMRDDGVGVGIHIADVAYFVQKDDLLDREALRRGTSVYLPDRTVNMFPPHLASDLASLCANEVRPAMSFLIEVSREGQIRDWRVERSQILVDHRLSYDDADNLILGESDGSLSEPLKELSALSRRIAAERQAKGALTINRPELKIRVENGDTDIKVLAAESPSRKLVSEMMVLANSLAAEFSAENKVPIIFRAQNPPSTEITAPETYDPVALDTLFQNLEPSRLSVYPQPHASLGLASYTQLTSPIRRFADLVIQRQFVAHLAGLPLPYELQELMQILATVQAADGNVRTLERRARRLFLLKHVSQNIDGPFEAIVIKKQSSGYLVETLDLFVRGQLVGETEYEPGQIVKTVVHHIDPEKGIFKLKAS